MDANKQIYLGENPPNEDIARLREAYNEDPAEIERRIEKLDEAYLAEKQKSVAERIAALEALNDR